MKTKLYLSFYSKVILCFLLITLSKDAGLFAQTDEPVFRDDFNRSNFGSSWQADLSWSIVNGAAYNFVDGIDAKLKTTAAYSQPSYVIETAARGFTTNYYREFRIT